MRTESLIVTSVQPGDASMAKRSDCSGHFINNCSSFPCSSLNSFSFLILLFILISLSLFDDIIVLFTCSMQVWIKYPIQLSGIFNMSCSFFHILPLCLSSCFSSLSKGLRVVLNFMRGIGRYCDVC